MPVNKFGYHATKHHHHYEPDEEAEEEINYHNRRITNVGEPVNDNDVVTKKYLTVELNKTTEKINEQIEKTRELNTALERLVPIVEEIVKKLKIIPISTTKQKSLNQNSQTSVTTESKSN